MSIFTRRHYIWLAEVGRQMIAADLDRSSKIDKCIQVLATALEAESPAFNHDRFMKAIYDPSVDLSTSNEMETSDVRSTKSR